jgi:CDP-diacylglycerol--glycerol-3-phosphate 3-phosphatidyltransferase
MKHVPNILTVSRILLAPVFIVLFVIPRPWAAVAALVLVTYFELSDFLDGLIARRLRLVSDFGKLMDPLADKMAHYAVFLALLTEPFVQGARWLAVLVLVLIARDALVGQIRVMAAADGRILAARASGKMKTAVQGAGLLAYLLVRALAPWKPSLADRLPEILLVVLVAMVLTSVGSLVDYCAANWNVLHPSREKPGGDAV